MNLWKLIYFLALIPFITPLEARVIKVSDTDEKENTGVSVRIDEDILARDILEEPEVENSISSKEVGEDAIASEEDRDTNPDYFIPPEKLSPPGGGPLLINTNIESTDPFPPVEEKSWWERWWDHITTWLCDKSS